MIHILLTGGTIEGVDYAVKDNGPKNGNVSIKDFLETTNVSFPYAIEEVFKKDSRFISQNDRKNLVDKIRATNSDKILITHGTFTMEDTAQYLGKLNLNKTIVLVGSFVSGSSPNTDAPFNFGYAISSVQFLKPDVYVAMNGEVFHWSDVTKNLETNKFERKNE
jgi:L-asparaginase